MPGRPTTWRNPPGSSRRGNLEGGQGARDAIWRAGYLLASLEGRGPRRKGRSALKEACWRPAPPSRLHAAARGQHAHITAYAHERQRPYPVCVNADGGVENGWGGSQLVLVIAVMHMLRRMGVCFTVVVCRVVLSCWGPGPAVEVFACMRKSAP